MANNPLDEFQKKHGIRPTDYKIIDGKTYYKVAGELPKNSGLIDADESSLRRIKALSDSGLRENTRTYTGNSIVDSIHNSDFIQGASRSYAQYGASINKALSKVTPDSWGFKDGQDFWNKEAKNAEANIKSEGWGLAGEIISDPVNLMPAGLLGKAGKAEHIAMPIASTKAQRIGMTLKSQAPRIAGSVVGGSAIGAGTMVAKNYGDDSKALSEKTNEIIAGAVFGGVLNGILAPLIRAMPTLSHGGGIAPTNTPFGSAQSLNANGVANGIGANHEAFGLSQGFGQQQPQGAVNTQPQGFQGTRIEQAGVQPQQNGYVPNWQPVPQYPPVPYNGQHPFYPPVAQGQPNGGVIDTTYTPNTGYPQVDPRYRFEFPYGASQQDGYVPNFQMIGNQAQLPMPTSTQQLMTHPRIQELLSLRENTTASQSAHKQNLLAPRHINHVNNGQGWDNKVTPATYEQNHAYDFEITKQDVDNIRRGNITPEIEYKLAKDLERLDNDPKYNQSNNEEFIPDRENPFADGYRGGYMSSPIINNLLSGGAGGAVGSQTDLNSDGKIDQQDMMMGALGGMAGHAGYKALGREGRGSMRGRGSYSGIKSGMFLGEGARGFGEAQRNGRVFNGKYDGMKRFEIDDSKAYLRVFPKAGLTGKLGDIFSHEELYKNYPNMRDINVRFTNDEGRAGSYDPSTNTIELDANENAFDSVSTVLHELQHGVQSREGFARGGNVEEMYRSLENKIYTLEQEGFLDEYVAKQYEKELNYLKSNKSEEAFRMYQNLAGEIESRIVEARRFMGKDQRMATDPYLNTPSEKDAIVRYGAIQSDKRRKWRDGEIPTSPLRRQVSIEGGQDGFYSKLERELNNLTNRRINPIDNVAVKDLMAYLKKKGISQDEIEWSGLRSLTDGKDRVKISELNLEFPEFDHNIGKHYENADRTPDEDAINDMVDQEWSEYEGSREYEEERGNAYDEWYSYGGFDEWRDTWANEIEAKARELADEAESPDDWEDYLGEAEDYVREHDGENDYYELMDNFTQNYMDDHERRWREDRYESLYENYNELDSDEFGSKYKDYALSNGDNNYAEHTTEISAPSWANRIRTNGSHWDGNVLYHNRTEDIDGVVTQPKDSEAQRIRQRFQDYENQLIRKYGSEDGVRQNITDEEKSTYIALHRASQDTRVNTGGVEGGELQRSKTLFVQETQSDHHQRGRESGYKGDISKEKRDEVVAQNDALYGRKSEAEKSLEAEIENITSQGLVDKDEIREAIFFYSRFTKESLVKRLDQLNETIATSKNSTDIGGSPLPNINKTFQERKNILMALDMHDNPDSVFKPILQAKERVQHIVDSIRANDALLSKYNSGVDNAPYRDTYQYKAMREMLKRAIDEGYDSVAFNSSDLQNGSFVSDPSEGLKANYDQKMPSYFLKYLKSIDPSAEMVTGYIPNTKHKAYSFKITDKIRESVRENGQPLFINGGGGLGGAMGGGSLGLAQTAYQEQVEGKPMTGEDYIRNMLLGASGGYALGKSGLANSGNAGGRIGSFAGDAPKGTKFLKASDFPWVHMGVETVPYENIRETKHIFDAMQADKDLSMRINKMARPHIEKILSDEGLQIANFNDNAKGVWHGQNNPLNAIDIVSKLEYNNGILSLPEAERVKLDRASIRLANFFKQGGVGYHVPIYGDSGDNAIELTFPNGVDENVLNKLEEHINSKYGESIIIDRGDGKTVRVIDPTFWEDGYGDVNFGDFKNHIGSIDYDHYHSDFRSDGGYHFTSAEDGDGLLNEYTEKYNSTLGENYGSIGNETSATRRSDLYSGNGGILHDQEAYKRFWEEANRELERSRGSYSGKRGGFIANPFSRAKSYNHLKQIVQNQLKKEWGEQNSFVKRWFVNTLSNDYMNVRGKAVIEDTKIAQKMERMHFALSQLDEADRTLLHRFMVGDSKVAPKGLEPLANQIRNDIDTLSKELVDSGVMDQSAFDEWKGHYLHRSYDKHFMKDVKAMLGRGFKIDEIKERGKVEVISQSEYQSRINSGQIDQSLLSKPLNEGGIRISQTPNGRVKIKRDWTEAERQAMGEITDSAITIPETLMRLNQMVNHARMLKEVEGVNGAVLPIAEAKKFTDDELKSAGYVALPKSPRYGVLAGRVVRQDVAKDIRGMHDSMYGEMFGNDSAGAKAWLTYLSLWKKAKTVWNAPSHVNNFASNMFLMHLSGMNTAQIGISLGKSVAMIKDGAKFEEIYRKSMIGRATKEELDMLNDLKGSMQYYDEAKELGMFGRSQLNDILRGKQEMVRASTLGKIDKFTEDAYQFEDYANRLSLYVHLRDKVKMSKEEAGMAVESIMPDYTRPMPEGWRILRDTGVSPFISWTYYTVPNMLRLMKTKQGGAQMAKALATIGAISYFMSDVNPAENINLPFVDEPWRKGYIPDDFTGRRIPIGKKGDTIDTVKVDRWIPYLELLNDPVNFAKSTFGGVTTNAFVGATMGNKFYNGRPITYDTKPAGEQAYDYAKFGVQSFAPIPQQALSGYDIIENMVRSEKKRKGGDTIKPRTMTQELLKFGGLNTMSYSKNQSQKEFNK